MTTVNAKRKMRSEKIPQKHFTLKIEYSSVRTRDTTLRVCDESRSRCARVPSRLYFELRKLFTVSGFPFPRCAFLTNFGRSQAVVSGTLRNTFSEIVRARFYTNETDVSGGADGSGLVI